jgi:hypothetical protein
VRWVLADPPDLFVELSCSLQIVRVAPNLVPKIIILLPMLQLNSVLIYNLWQENSKGQGKRARRNQDLHFLYDFKF